MGIYEAYGRLMEERLVETEQHLRTIALLGRLKRNELSLDDIEVTENSWKILEPEVSSPDVNNEPS